MLTTVARAKRHASLSGVNSTLLENLLSAAGRIIEDYCGREFESGSHTERHTGDGTAQVWLRHFPITALTSVTITDGNGTDYSIDTGEFDYDASTREGDGRLWFYPWVEGTSRDYNVFPTGQTKNVSIVYTAGFSTMPDDIQEACIKIALALYGQGATSKPGVTSFKMGEYSETRGTGSTKAEIDTLLITLNNYRVLDPIA